MGGGNFIVSVDLWGEVEWSQHKSMVLLYLFLFHAVKGSMAQDFLLRVCIMNQSPPPEYSIRAI